MLKKTVYLPWKLQADREHVLPTCETSYVRRLKSNKRTPHCTYMDDKCLPYINKLWIVKSRTTIWKILAPLYNEMMKIIEFMLNPFCYKLLLTYIEDILDNKNVEFGNALM